MKAILGAALLAVVVVAASAAARPDAAPFDEKKLIGKWQQLEAKKDTHAVLEFKKGGKLLVTITLDGSATVVEGSWVLMEADLIVVVDLAGKKETTTFKITKLDDQTLEYVEPKGKTFTLKKLKS